MRLNKKTFWNLSQGLIVKALSRQLKVNCKSLKRSQAKFWYQKLFHIIDGIQAQMAHAKAVNRKKNFEDTVDSPRLMPIGGERPQANTLFYSFVTPLKTTL
jgi:hypothetical protein